MSQETKNKNEQPKDEAVSEQVPEKELPAEEPKENAENPQEAKAEEAKKEEKPSELDTVKGSLQRSTTDTFVWRRNTITSASAARRKRTTYTR